MFKSQGGKFSSVFGTSKDTRNQETPLHIGNSVPKKLLMALTLRNKNPLPFPADGGS